MWDPDFIFAILCFCTFKIEAHENIQKLYFCAEELEVTNYGFYVLEKVEGQVSVDTIFYDDHGLYIKLYEAARGRREEQILIYNDDP